MDSYDRKTVTNLYTGDNAVSDAAKDGINISEWKGRDVSASDIWEGAKNNPRWCAISVAYRVPKWLPHERIRAAAGAYLRNGLAPFLAGKHLDDLCLGESTLFHSLKFKR